MRTGWLGLVLLAFGCGSLTLRPVQTNHALRKAEVSQALGVEPQRIDAALQEDQAACDKLDGQVTGWTAVSVVGGALSGGSGLSTLLTDDATARYAIGGVVIGVAAVTAFSAFWTTHLGQKYARRCAVNLGGR